MEISHRHSWQTTNRVVSESFQLKKRRSVFRYFTLTVHKRTRRVRSVPVSFLGTTVHVSLSLWTRVRWFPVYSLTRFRPRPSGPMFQVETVCFRHTRICEFTEGLGGPEVYLFFPLWVPREIRSSRTISSLYSVLQKHCYLIRSICSLKIFRELIDFHF